MTRSELLNLFFPLKGELGSHSPQPSGSSRTAARKKGEFLEDGVSLSKSRPQLNFYPSSLMERSSGISRSVNPNLVGDLSPSPENKCNPTF